MKPLRHPLMPVDGRGKRSNETLLRLDERDAYLIEAARFFPGSDREAARLLRIALATYRGGRWRRDASEALCPVQHRGKPVAVLWKLLKVRDAIPSAETIRKVLARGDEYDAGA